MSLLRNAAGGPGRRIGAAGYLPYVVVAELYYGAEKSARQAQNYATLNRFLSASRILYPDEEMLRVYARTRLTLKQMGKPIPENDLWIAACALRYNLALVTRDAHFLNVVGLTVETW